MTKKISLLSIYSLHLELLKGGKKIGDGTGFIYLHQKSKKKFLITNYHVLTCRDPKEPARLLHGYPDSPDEIIFYMPSRPTYEPKPGSIKIDAESKWFEHRRRSDGVDIVAIPIDFPGDAAVLTQDQLPLVEDIDLEVGSNLFVIGFPWGFSAGDYYPIWKKGTVASEPLFKPNGLSKFYIDAYTHPGMSGSPVFAAEWRNLVEVDKNTHDSMQMYEQGKINIDELLDKVNLPSSGKTFSKQFFRLIGIYSGRVASGKNDPNVGIVWQRILIDELFTDPVIVQHPYPPIVVT
ncbi:serine protease [Comamonas sp. wu1-DMT]|uniref:S1 family peptidase n=1 Tax=Comamonas sp. wu1-DMT TaxID=3126390 RepID=UPI0032E47BAB